MLMTVVASITRGALKPKAPLMWINIFSVCRAYRFASSALPSPVFGCSVLRSSNNKAGQFAASRGSFGKSGTRVPATEFR